MNRTVMFIFIIIIITSTIVVANNDALGNLTVDFVDYIITVNGQPQKFNGKIISINNTTYVPLREYCEMQKMNVSWNEEVNTINVTDQKLLYNKLKSLLMISGNDPIRFINLEYKDNEKYNATDVVLSLAVDNEYMLQDNRFTNGSIPKFEEMNTDFKKKIINISSQNGLNMNDIVLKQSIYTLFSDSQRKPFTVTKIIGGKSLENDISVILYMSIPEKDYFGFAK